MPRSERLKQKWISVDAGNLNCKQTISKWKSDSKWCTIRWTWSIRFNGRDWESVLDAAYLLQIPKAES